MAKSLYLDCSNGVSGDMIVAALLDLGASEERLRAVLGSLPVAGEFDVAVSRVQKAGLDACDFDVRLHGVETHDHDMAYLHGGAGMESRAGSAGAHPHDHGTDHDHEHDVPHAHGAAHTHGACAHVHRGIADVLGIIDAATMTDGARDLARRAFEILARAEAAAHGVPIEQVHFHEVGAVDSIVDIISAAVLADDLAPAAVYATPLPDGHGTVRCQHGVIPVPVPAVVNICSQQGIPFAHTDAEGELVTPTGAALIAAMDARFTLPSSYRVERVGIGAGKRAYVVPSLVRAMLIEEDPAAPLLVSSTSFTLPVGNSVPASCPFVYKLECDIDDATPESLAYAAERVLASGAREAHWVPIFTKKARPAYQLQVIVASEDLERVEGAIFSETTTIGIRRARMERTVLPRETSTVETSYGPVRVKTVTLPDGSRRTKPEYDDVAAAARAAGKPFNEIAREIMRLLQ